MEVKLGEPIAVYMNSVPFTEDSYNTKALSVIKAEGGATGWCYKSCYKS